MQQEEKFRNQAMNLQNLKQVTSKQLIQMETRDQIDRSATPSRNLPPIIAQKRYSNSDRVAEALQHNYRELPVVE